MTKRDSFSDAEWSLINEILAGVGLVPTALDAGVVSAVKEFRAMTKALSDAGSTYAGVELIQAMVAEPESRKSTEPLVVPTGDGFVARLLAKVPEAVRVVDAKATAAEAQAYRKLLREVGRASASASGGGIFGTGEKVSDQEREFLEQLDRATA